MVDVTAAAPVIAFWALWATVVTLAFGYASTVGPLIQEGVGLDEATLTRSTAGRRASRGA